MSLVINHNMMAANTTRILGNTYSRLAQNTQRLTSGLRINSAADDAAGLAIRELMRSDISTMRQGIRNAMDGISLLQTAEGAMAVIDEKLIRMKELAEQAATGTYTTVQREMINTEYQAMAKEIDRIANATNFNGVKLLDGSMNSMHDGRGLKIHFGAGNSDAEDYYFVNLSDLRASTETGLRVGGDARNDIWGTTGTYDPNNTAGCCGGGIPALNKVVDGWASGQIFSYGYNWDWNADSETDLNQGRYIAGAWAADETPTLEELVAAVNQGSQARVRVDFQSGLSLGSLLNSAIASAQAQRICVGDEVYYYGDSTLSQDVNGAEKSFISLSGASVSGLAAIDNLGSLASASVAHALALAINNNSESQFWARVEDNPYLPGYVSVYIFCKEGGARNDLKACDERLGAIRSSAAFAGQIKWYNDELDAAYEDGTTFNNGGQYWGVMKAVPTGLGSWGVRLEGRDVGDKRDLRIFNVGDEPGMDLRTGSGAYMGYGFGLLADGTAAGNLAGLNRDSFFEIQNAADGAWAGSHLRTQSSAQEALDAVQEAVQNKERIRASLGAYINRLENTITNLEIQAENLQAAESRISDVDIAAEMTEFVKNQVLTQAAISMLSQANSLPQMALSLLNG
ncbi:MAG: flagellin [Candidatus Adiutrix sp.]|nr:flagellin [Candidatus Adiutrix sp.]